MIWIALALVLGIGSLTVWLKRRSIMRTAKWLGSKFSPKCSICKADAMPLYRMWIGRSGGPEKVCRECTNYICTERDDLDHVVFSQDNSNVSLRLKMSKRRDETCPQCNHDKWLPEGSTAERCARCFFKKQFKLPSFRSVVRKTF